VPKPSSDDRVFSILKVGQQVTTPEGPGRVVAIELVGGSYWDGDRLELEPPQVTVKLDSSGQKTVVCPCELGLQDPRAEATLHESFEKLWPPVPDKAPEANTAPVSTDVIVETQGTPFSAKKLPVAFLKTIAAAQLEEIKAAVDGEALPATTASLIVDQLHGLRTASQLIKHLRWSGKLLGAHTTAAQGEIVRTATTALVFENPSNRNWLEQLETQLLELLHAR
jgi:hypothetical protein